MNRVRDFFEELMYEYSIDVLAKKSTYNEQQLTLVPEALREFYKEISEADLSFGHIYSIDDALKEAKVEPFNSEGWFPFGQDNYFSFWLCSYQPDKENLSFTTWDHKSGCDIDGAVYEDVIELLEDVRDEYEYGGSGYYSIIMSDKPTNGLKDLLEIKKILKIKLSSKELLELYKNTPIIIKEHLSEREAREKLGKLQKYNEILKMEHFYYK